MSNIVPFNSRPQSFAEALESLSPEQQAVLREINKIERIMANRRDKVLRATTATCVKKDCGAVYPIGDLVCETELYWETGHDDWRHGESSWVCPNCNHRNRMELFQPHLKWLSPYFKDRTRYERDTL